MRNTAAGNRIKGWVLCVILCGIGLLLLAGCGQGTGTTKGTAYETIDLDLTRMSATMVYSEVFDMMYKPEEYLGKTMKVRGEFNAMYDDENEDIIYTCIIRDATACCAQGIEFDLKKIPDVYPQGGTEVTIEGVYDSYQTGGETCGILKDAVFVDR